MAANLDFLKRYSTPTVANAIELFEIRPRNEGFFRPGLHCLLPDAPPIIGYAATCMIASEQERTFGDESRPKYWEYVEQTPGPRIAIVQDIDDTPGIGSFWGEVNASIHLALGCVGTVTNGGIRDMPEMRRLGFQALYTQPCVSHAYVHVARFGCPVRFLGLSVNPGDLIQADEHGALLIPTETLPRLKEAIEEMERRERPVIDYCKSKEFTRDGLRRAVDRHIRNAKPFVEPKAADA
jgi:4-hydroxy-4-methyl-2-oxoglutarate aldolase